MPPDYLDVMDCPEFPGLKETVEKKASPEHLVLLACPEDREEREKRDIPVFPVSQDSLVSPELPELPV